MTISLALKSPGESSAVLRGNEIKALGGFMIRRVPLISRTLAALAAVFLFSSCATTNVKPMGSAGESFQLEQDEEKLWQDSRRVEEMIEKSGFEYQDAELERYVNEVAARLVPPEIKSLSTKPQVKVLRDLELNAFVLPHGAVYVHAGMLAHMENEDQLAAVLGHEQTHFIHRHTLKRFRKIQNTEAVMFGVQMLVFAAGAAAGVLAPGLLDRRTGAIMSVAAVSGYGRELEAEADTVGFKSMLAAGYDPAQSVRIFEILQNESGEPKSNQTLFFSTHPRLQERIDNFRGLIESAGTAGPGRARQPNDAGAFTNHTQRLLMEYVAMNVEKGRLNVAESALRKYFRSWADDPEAFFMQGEIYRRSGRDERHVQLTLDAYKKAIQQDPSYAKAYREIGLLFRDLKRNEEATAALARFLILSPQAPDAPIIRSYIEEFENSQGIK
jgi:beta-barrel assembly-enhancing protease